MNDRKSDIIWNADKKKARDLKREQERAKRIIGEKYQAWKADLCSQPRTRSEVIKYFYKLRDMVLDYAKECALLKLEDFNEFTYAIIERHITTLITAQITGHNVIKQHVPVSLVAGGHVAIAKTEIFRNKGDLLKIDFIQWFADQPGFTGFSWQRVEQPLNIEFYLLAHYASGDSWLVGTLINDEGLDDIPCYEDLKETIMLPVDFVQLRQTGRTTQAGEPAATDPTAASAGEATPPPSDSAGSDAVGATEA